MSPNDLPHDHSKTKSRKGYVSVHAVDPSDGGEWDLLISHEKWTGLLRAAWERQKNWLLPFVKGYLNREQSSGESATSIAKLMRIDGYAMSPHQVAHSIEKPVRKFPPGRTKYFSSLSRTKESCIFGIGTDVIPLSGIFLAISRQGSRSNFYERPAVMATQDINLDDAFAQPLLAKAGQGDDLRDEPKAFYNVDGDCIEILLAADSYRAERLSDLLTIYISRETGSIVGILMKRVKQFVKDLLAESPGFRIEIRDGKVRLLYLLTAAIWKSSDGADKVKLDVYRAMQEELAGANLELDLQLA